MTSQEKECAELDKFRFVIMKSRQSEQCSDIAVLFINAVLSLGEASPCLTGWWSER